MQATKTEIQNVGRLKKRSDFLRLQHSGIKWVAKGMIIQIAPASEKQRHFGITVTKRVSKSAVCRNRIKRRLRAVAYDVLPAHLADDIDIVLIGRPETAIRPYATLKKDLIWCLGKLGYLQGDKEQNSG